MLSARRASRLIIGTFISAAGITAILAGAGGTAFASTPDTCTAPGVPAGCVGTSQGSTNNGTSASVSMTVGVPTATALTLGTDYSLNSSSGNGQPLCNGLTGGQLAYPYTNSTPSATFTGVYDNGTTLQLYATGSPVSGDSEPSSCITSANGGTINRLTLYALPDQPASSGVQGAVTGTVKSNDVNGWQIQVTADALNAPAAAAALGAGSCSTNAPTATSAVTLDNASGAYADEPWNIAAPSGSATYNGPNNSGTNNGGNPFIGGIGLLDAGAKVSGTYNGAMSCSATGVQTDGLIPWTDVALQSYVNAGGTSLVNTGWLSDANANSSGQIGALTPAIVTGQSSTLVGQPSLNDNVTQGTTFADVVSITVPSAQVPTSGYTGELNYTVWSN